MKGRGSPQQQGQRGRGYFGRGGRGQPQNHNRGGTVSSIGAYLDLPPGKDIVPGAVTKWMNKIREYAMTACDTSICSIFGQDGTVGDYPVYVEPQEPAEPSTPAAKKRWEILLVIYVKNIEKFDLDKRKLHGIMLGQMSESSKIRARGIAIGDEAILEDDPRKLLQSILATHIGDSRLAANHHLFNIRQRYNSLVMGPGDSLITFYQNMRSTLSGIEQAYTRADKDNIDDHYPEAEMALKFTMGLNHYYDEYKSYYVNYLRPWPENLEDAYTEASKYNPMQKRGYHAGGVERANAFAFSGRGGRNGRGNRGGRGGRGHQGGRNGKGNGKFVREHVRDDAESPEEEKGTPVAVYTASNTPPHGYKRGPCNYCGKYGHLAAECRGEPEQEHVQYWKEAGPRSPGGNKFTPPSGPGKGK